MPPPFLENREHLPGAFDCGATANAVCRMEPLGSFFVENNRLDTNRYNESIEETHRKQLRHLGKERLHALAELLDAARAKGA